MLEHCDFVTQASVARRGRRGCAGPDREASGRQERRRRREGAARRATSTRSRREDDEARAIALATHARQVRDHMAKLAAKAYWRQFAPTPEFVVMFLPDEAFLRAALRSRTRAHRGRLAGGRHPRLRRRRCFAAAPHRRHDLAAGAVAESAREVHELGQELYERLGTLAGARPRARPVDPARRRPLQPDGRVARDARARHGRGASATTASSARS